MRTESRDIAVAPTLEGRAYPLGEGSSVVIRRHQGSGKILLDGTVVKPGDLVGEIGIGKIQDSPRDGGFVGASREIYTYFLLGMVDLALDIKTGNFPSEVIAITGISHLGGGKLPTKLGFYVDEKGRSLSRLKSALNAARMSLNAGERGDTLNLIKKKWRRTKRVWISKNQIVENKYLFQDLMGKEVLSFTKARFGDALDGD